MPKAAALWTCPTCRRHFAKRHQWHSCSARGVAAHFRGKDPRLRKIFDRLIARLRKVGPLRVDAVSTSINLASRYHFGGVSVKREYLRVGFLAAEPIADARIAHRLRLGPRRVGHSVILRSPTEVDAQLMRWLAQAYRMQARAARSE